MPVANEGAMMGLDGGGCRARLCEKGAIEISADSLCRGNSHRSRVAVSRGLWEASRKSFDSRDLDNQEGCNKIKKSSLYWQTLQKNAVMSV